MLFRSGNVASLNLDGNASNILYGNGVFASAPVTYGNSNVATFLASYGSNTITTTGNANVGNLGTTGVYATSLSATANANVGNLGTGGLVTATGNITGGNIITAGLISATGNITGGNLIGALANGNSKVAIAAAAGNVVTTVGAADILTVYSSGIKVAGGGVLQSPGGATAITLNNNGANIPTVNVTTALNVTGSYGANIYGTLEIGRAHV